MKPCTPIYPCSGCLNESDCTGNLIVREGGRRVITTHDEPDHCAPDEAGRWVGFVIIAAICVGAFILHVAYRYAIA